MSFGRLFEKHPNKICIITPKKRSKKNGFVKKWKFLRAVDSVEEARHVLHCYDQENVEAVPINTCEPLKNYSNLELPPDLVARYFRCFFGADAYRGSE